jgi:hypothetical protein
MKKPTELKISTAIVIFSVAVLAKIVLFGLQVLMIKYFYHPLPLEEYSVFNLASWLIIDILIVLIVLPWFNVGVLEQFRKVRFKLLVMFVLMAVLISLLILPIIDPIDFVRKLSQQQLTIKKFDFALLTAPRINEIIYFFLMVIITPIVEEIVYRGFLFNLLLKKYSVKIAFIASSLIFALIHLRFAGIGFLFLYGLFLGYAYFKTKSLIAPILAHFTINFLSSFSTHSVVELNSASFIKYLLIYITGLFLVFIIFSIINKMQLFNSNSDDSSNKI